MDFGFSSKFKLILHTIWIFEQYENLLQSSIPMSPLHLCSNFQFYFSALLPGPVSSDCCFSILRNTDLISCSDCVLLVKTVKMMAESRGVRTHRWVTPTLCSDQWRVSKQDFIQHNSCHKPPQLLKINFKDDLSMLSPLSALDCKTAVEGGSMFCSWKKFIISTITVVLY